MNPIPRLYDSVRWRKARSYYLAINPLCIMCLRVGRERRATVVDHIRDHGGDYGLFWDQDNWQGLCPTCHSGAKRIQSAHGYSQAAGLDGLPIDSGHPWSKPR